MEDIQKIIKEEISAFKNELANFATKEGLQTAFAQFKESLEEKGVEAKKELETLTKDVERLGAELQASLLKAKNLEKKSFKDIYSEQLKDIEENISKGISTSIITSKDVLSTSITDGTLSYRDNMVGQIQRGKEFVRDLLQVVPMGSNTQGVATWFEQSAITNNAGNVAEATASASPSAITWAQKTLTGKRISDWIKIGMDQLKDVDFVQGEVTNLINRNMRLKENDQLLNGLGTGNEVKGLMTYAHEFDTTGIKITKPNMIDIVGKCITQIENETKGSSIASHVISNRVLVDGVRYEKDSDGQYVFPAFALGQNVGVAGIQLIENALIDSNKLLVGDMSIATLYVWDDLVLEFAQIEDDKKTGKITVIAYMRENLRVKDCEVNGLVKVSDFSATKQAIADVNP